ncbi:MAG: hypothetical protein IKT08_06910 [Bacteroidales bacterium]|nr:hypothetical protein [Bacteroidales bacterium]
MHILSKSTYIKGLQCEKALYMTKKHPYLRDKLSIEQRAKFQRGTDVGILAHQYFPGGVNMAPNSPSQFPKKVVETVQNLRNPAVNAMYEAVFQYNDTLVMVDLLVREGEQWRAVEVKSSLKLSPTYYNDAALQYYVLNGCGVPLSDFQLMHLDPDYVKQGPIDVKQLFKLVSVMDFAKEQEATIAANVERLKNVVALPHAPQVEIGPHCHEPYPCDFLGHCWKNVPQDDPDVSYTIDYKTLFAQAPNPKPRSIGYLNLLLYRPAVPEIDGTNPYQEMMLGFALSGENEPDGHSIWHCFEDHSRWHEGIDVLEERLSHYDLAVCFTPIDIASTLMRHDILQNQSFGHKIFNLYEVLQNAHLLHPKLKSGFNLQHIAEALFHDVKLFEHSRILVEATALELTGYEQAKDDLLTENEVVKRIYQHFFR